MHDLETLQARYQVMYITVHMYVRFIPSLQYNTVHICRGHHACIADQNIAGQLGPVLMFGSGLGRLLFLEVCVCVPASSLGPASSNDGLCTVYIKP
jgi:hypothetical protein